MNALIGERGLECRDRLPQLVTERRSHAQCSSGGLDIKLHQKEQSQHSVHASVLSSGESDSDSDMDRRLKRGRGGRRRRSKQNQRAPTISSAKQQQQVTSRKKEEERAKAQVQNYSIIHANTTDYIM